MSSVWTAASRRSSVVIAGPSPTWEIAAVQRGGGLFVEHVGVPAVGHVGCVDAADATAAEVVGAVGGDRCRGSVGEVVDRDHASAGGVGDLGVRSGGEEEIHGAALVGFEMSDHDPAQPFER